MRLTRLHALSFLLFVGSSHALGAQDLAAPEPTVNPTSLVWITFRITSEGDDFDSVTAEGKYALMNHSCAPQRPFSGSYIEQPANVAADVHRDGNAFVIRVLKDRFEHDACVWEYTGMSARFRKNGMLVGQVGTTPLYVNADTSPVSYVCDPHESVPACLNMVHNPRAPTYKASHPDAFIIKVELMQ